MKIFAVKSRKATWTLLSYVLLSINVLTDAYGFSQQADKKSINKDVSQSSFAKNHPKLGTFVLQSNGTKTVEPITNTQPIKMVTVQKTLNPEDKVIVEVKELKRMHQQVTKERTKDPNDAKKLQLLQHIKKQIQIHQTQLQQKERKYRNALEQHNRVTKPQKAQKLHTPRQLFANTRQKSNQRNGVFRILDQPNVAQHTVQHNKLPQNQEPQTFDLNSHVQLQTQTSNRLRKQSNHQQNNIVSANQILLPRSAGQVLHQPHFVRNEPRAVNTYQVNRPVAQQIPPQHTDILVPVSALSSQHILNSQGLLQDKIYLVNPMTSDNKLQTGQNKLILFNPIASDAQLQAVSNGGISTAAHTTQLAKSLLTTTTATTASTTTTESPSPTNSMPISTSTSTTVSTSSDMETLKQDFLKGEMKKQELEIRKLRLEIRALQREERNNLPEMENDDLPQQRRGQPGRRQTMPPVPESTTAINMETLEQTLLKKSMKKQELEIRKLQLEIRALQREERSNLPEMENDDLPQQRRGKVGRRRLMPPYIR